MTDAAPAHAPPSLQVPPRFKTRQLSLIIALEETGSLRQAAERVHISQPAATRLLHEIEGQLEVQLFTRSRQGMQPTPAGIVMIGHARALLNAMRDAYSNTRATAAGEAGDIRMGIFGSANPQKLADSVIELKRRFPGLHVNITEAPLEMLLTALRDGELDLIINRMQGASFSQEFRHELLYTESFVLACGAGNALARKRKLRAADLLERIWLIPPQDTLLRQQVDAYFAANFREPPTHLVQTTSLLANLALLAQSDAIAVMAKHTANFFSDHGMLKSLPVPLEALSRPVSLITLRTQSIKPQVQYLMQLLRQQTRPQQGKER